MYLSRHFCPNSLIWNHREEDNKIELGIPGNLIPFQGARVFKDFPNNAGGWYLASSTNVDKPNYRSDYVQAV